MKVTFVDVDRDTLYLLPPSIQEWLPEKHLARFVVEIVEQINLQSLKASYCGRGSQPYNPEMLVALLFYGYATGVFSSRKLERSTYDSVAFRYIAANSHPDHDTIATFRRRFLPQLTKIFVEILSIAHEMKVLKLGKVSIDGTKVKANASKHKALSYGHACKLEKQLEAEVAELLQKAESVDNADIPDGMDIPTELSIRQKRVEAIKEAKVEIERRAAERLAEEQKVYETKGAERAKKEQQTGKKARGKKPQPPTPGPTEKDQVNLNDKESRIMPTSGGGFEQAYNVQAGVDTETMLIVTNHVTQAPNDKKEMEPALTNLKQLPEKLGAVTDILADNGYFSEENVMLCQQNKVTSYIPVNREKHHLPIMDRFQEPLPLSDNATTLDAMKHRLKTQSGKAVYAKRKSTIEPVFGIIKSAMGFRQFLLRGMEAVKGEWDLVCIAFNLKRLFALAK
ncbi:MAG: IS1182 family transposase [Desulfomonilaceae bacterium]